VSERRLPSLKGAAGFRQGVEVGPPGERQEEESEWPCAVRRQIFAAASVTSDVWAASFRFEVGLRAEDPQRRSKSVWKRDKIQSLVSAGRIFERFDQGPPKLGRPVQAAKPIAFPNAKPAGGGPAGQNTIRVYFGSFTPTRRKCQGSLTRPVTAVARPSCPRKRFAEHTATALEDDSVTLRSASTALNERNTGFAATGREMTLATELDVAGRPTTAWVGCAPAIATDKALRFTDEDDCPEGGDYLTGDAVHHHS
jgi:hypothetical protein